MIALIEKLPLAYIYLGALAAFAFVTSGLLRFSEWQSQRSPENKITFLKAEVSFVPDRKDPKIMRAIKLGFIVVSKALFPIEIEVVELRTQFMDRVSNVPMPKNVIRTVSMGGIYFVHDRSIDLTGINLNNLVAHGSIEFSLRYGVPKKRNYEYKCKKRIELFFSEEGNLKAYNAFDYTEEPSISLG